MQKPLVLEALNEAVQLTWWFQEVHVYVFGGYLRQKLGGMSMEKGDLDVFLLAPTNDSGKDLEPQFRKSLPTLAIMLTHTLRKIYDSARVSMAWTYSGMSYPSHLVVKVSCGAKTISIDLFTGFPRITSPDFDVNLFYQNITTGDLPSIMGKDKLAKQKDLRPMSIADRTRQKIATSLFARVSDHNITKMELRELLGRYMEREEKLRQEGWTIFGGLKWLEGDCAVCSASAQCMALECGHTICRDCCVEFIRTKNKSCCEKPIKILFNRKED